MRGDAEYIQVIHTNPGGLGKRNPIGKSQINSHLDLILSFVSEFLGDADFYPNGLHPHPAGCLTMVCAHLRAPEFYAETVYPGFY